MSTVDTPFDAIQSFPFPGRVVMIDDTDAANVKNIQQRLNSIGCGPIDEDGIFDVDTENAVKLFQSRFPDVTGRPLKVDGKVGALTWGSLFGSQSVPSSLTAPSKLTEAVIAFARTQLKVRENPLGANRGPEVDEYQRAVGLSLSSKPKVPGFAWCVAFTYFCYQEAAAKLGSANPHIKTAGVLAHWAKAKSQPGIVRITNSQAINDPSLVKPGSLFIIDHGGGQGHSGIVTEVAHGRLKSIEGNTNNGGSREGIGVFERDARKIADINVGFIDYSSFS